MKVFNCILGIFSLFSAFYCMLFPGMTFLSIGWIVTILMGVWGICMIFDYFSTKKENKEANKTAPEKNELIMGVFGLISGIAAAILCIAAMFSVSVRLVIDAISLYFLAGWIMIIGLMSILAALKIKKILESKNWILTLIMGILLVLCGIYGFGHIIFLAQSVGIYAGFAFAIYGVRLILSIFEKKE